MKKIYLMAAASVMLAAMTGCSDDRDALNGGQGTVRFTTTLNSDVKVSTVSRGDLEDEYGESLMLWISNAKGVVRQYNGMESIPAEGTQLVAGHYVAEAWAGDSCSASFDDRYFKGFAEFDVTNGSAEQVNIVCKIANVVATATFAESVADVLTDYTLTVSHQRGKLEFGANDDRRGYFMMPSTDKDLAWTLTGHRADGTLFSRTGVITDAQPATLYAFHIGYNPVAEEVGGSFIQISIDETTLDVSDELLISMAPQIEGYNFDLAEEQHTVPGAGIRQVVYITASVALQEVIIECENAGFIEHLAIGGGDFNFLGISDELKAAIAAKGIKGEYTENADGTSNFKLVFDEQLTGSLGTGNYAISISVKDANNKKMTAEYQLSITEASASLDALNEAQVYAKKATISGQVIKAGISSAVLEYRVAGDTNWTNANATADGNAYSAQLTGLTPGTKYEYRMRTPEDNFATEVKTFTTEQAAQLPNAGFENWTKNGKLYLVYGAGEEMFWDSGNHGSTTIGESITVPDESIKHSGNYSIRMSSQFVGVGVAGKFAAGNVFTGQYLRTDGMDGVLGWGRSFTSRPVALKGYAKYTPAAVTHSSISQLPKGEMDKGKIYVALMDDNTDKSEGTPWPVIIRTKKSNQALFDPESEHVIAYGEIVFEGETVADDASGLRSFRIELEYRKEGVRPSSVILTASASMYGDYFTGGPSTLWMDDLEFEY